MLSVLFNEVNAEVNATWLVQLGVRISIIVTKSKGYEVMNARWVHIRHPTSRLRA